MHLCHPHIVLNLRHMLFRGGLLGDLRGQHEFRFEHRSEAGRPIPSSVAAIHLLGPHDEDQPLITFVMALPSVTFVPAPVEVLGHGARLNDQVVREVYRLDLATGAVPAGSQVTKSRRKALRLVCGLRWSPATYLICARYLILI